MMRFIFIGVFKFLVVTLRYLYI